MKKRMVLVLIFAIFAFASVINAQNLLDRPESVEYDSLNNRYLVANAGNGNIIQVDPDGTQSDFYSGLGGSSLGLHIIGNTLYIARGLSDNLIGIDLDSREIVKTIYIPGSGNLNGNTSDNVTYVYLSDFTLHQIYKVNIIEETFTVFADSGFNMPNGLIFDGDNNRLLVSNSGGSFPILAVDLDDSSVSTIVEPGVPQADGFARDQFGYYYLSSYQTGNIYKYDTGFVNPVEIIASGYVSPADICYNLQDHCIAIPNIDGDRLDLFYPHTDITADTTWGYVTLPVNFNGGSDLPVDEWYWDFGDGETGDIQSLEHVYTEPGMHDVTLRIVSGDDTLSETIDDYIIALADTVKSLDVQGDPGQAIEVGIYAANTIPLNVLRIPVEYSGILPLTLDSFSTAGCRTEHFDNISVTNSEPMQKRASYKISNNYGSATPDLEPGNDLIMKLYFTISPSASFGKTTSIVIDGYSSYILKFESSIIDYEPIDVPGTISLIGMCGDADDNGAVNILDVTFLIAYLYKSGPEPSNLDMCNANGDSSVNILDVTYLISYLYKSGPDPVC